MKKLMLLLLLAVIISCNGGDVDPVEAVETVETEVTVITKEYGGLAEPIDIEKMMADDEELEFIYFESGEAQHYFPYQVEPLEFTNVYYSSDDPDCPTPVDQLSLHMRSTPDGPDGVIININLNDTQFMVQEYPLTINSDSPEMRAEMHFKDLEIMFRPEQSESQNMLIAGSGGSYSITITDYDGTYVTARFSGTLRNNFNENDLRVIPISNGLLRLKFTIEYAD